MRKAMIFGLALAGIALALSEPAAAGASWGPLSKSNCMGGVATKSCSRTYDAILWNIPWGASWEETCKRTPHPTLGLPASCKNNGLNMWGHWLVRSDPSCGSWCSGARKKK